MMKSSIKLFLIFFSLCVSYVSGQSTNINNPQTVSPIPQQSMSGTESSAQRTERQQSMRTDTIPAGRQKTQTYIDIPSTPIDLTVKRRDVLPPSPKPTKEQKVMLQPDMQDAMRYETFLKQPNTGLIKIFPDAGCEQNAGIVRVDAECLKWIPNSGFYSFRRKKYTSESLADVRYKDGFLVSDGLLTQGIMIALGNLPLEQLSLSDNSMRFLTEYKPESRNDAAEVQTKKIAKGIKAGNYIYRNSWQSFENNTYALRSIAYQGKYLFKSQGRLRNLLEGDERKDVIVVFRIVRKNSDGSLTILWKELARKDSPKLIRSETDKTKTGN